LIGRRVAAILSSQCVRHKEWTMPEMPEVENIMLGLREVLPGRRVAQVWIGTPLIVQGPYRRRWRSFVARN